MNELRVELTKSLKDLQMSSIAAVDLQQCAIGPGMGVYSKYAKVLESDGSAVSVRMALQMINRELDLYFNGQDSGVDSESNFCIEMFMQNGYNPIKYGEAEVLANAKNISIQKLVNIGVVEAKKGLVRLLDRFELPEKLNLSNIYLLCQQLVYVIYKKGYKEVAKMIEDIRTSEPDQAKTMAYRLYDISDKRGWKKESLAFNMLVMSWEHIQQEIAKIRDKKPAKPEGGVLNFEE